MPWLRRVRNRYRTRAHVASDNIIDVGKYVSVIAASGLRHCDFNNL